MRRINLIGGPGVGKSTLAAGIFYRFKMKHVDIELVAEVAKSWAYEKRQIAGFDQLILTGTQIHNEELFLRNGAKHIVSDSPIYLGACYGRHFKFPLWELLMIQAKEFDKQYDPLNLFLVRSPDQFYSPLGRFQTKDEAIMMDNDIYSILNTFNIKMTSVFATDHNKVFDIVEEAMR